MENNNRQITVLLVLIIITSSFSSSSSIEGSEVRDFNPEDTLKVLTTLSIIEDWTWQVGKGFFQPISLVTGLEDPHTYEMSTEERELLAEADLLIRLGVEGLESWLNANINAILEDNPDLVIVELVNPDMLLDDPAAEETGVKNPHVWMSPINAEIFINNITETVSELDPSNQAHYEVNRDNYLLDLNDLIYRIESEYRKEIQGLKVVEHHPSFMYLFDLLGIERVGIIEEEHDHHAEPSPEHIQKIIEEMQAENVKIIVVQPQIESETVNQIAEEVGAKIALLSPLLPAFGLTSYIALIEYNIYALQNPENIYGAPINIVGPMLGIFSIGLIFLVTRKRIISNK